MVEFAHPNIPKAAHIGHLRNMITGESLTRIFEAVGYNVVRQLPRRRGYAGGEMFVGHKTSENEYEQAKKRRSASG